MCRFKSGILLKDRVYISDGDSHSDMLEELGIADTRQNAERVFVRAELYPEDGDVFSPIDQWKWNVDQDILPEWYVEEYEKHRFVEAVKKWAEQHIIIGQDGLTLTTGKSYYLKDCKNIELSGDCFVTLLDNSQVSVMRGSSQIGEMWDGSQVSKMWDSSQVSEMRDNSQVSVMWDSSQVSVMRDSSQVSVMRDSSQVSVMRGSSQIGEMRDNSQVSVMRDSSQVSVMRGSSQVSVMWDSSQVSVMRGSSQIGEMWDGSQVSKMWDNSIASIASDYSDDVSVSSIRLHDNATVKDHRTKTIYQAGDWKLVLVESD